MGAPDTVPDLQYAKSDGTLYSRQEMEEQLRKEWSKIHWLRIKANKIYGLPKQAAFDMTEAVLRHWVLDEMVRRGQITGDMVGVNVQNYNDENEKRQFIQRLIALIQAGQALPPKVGEGVDMSNLPQPPGPGVPPNGQSPQAFIPPPPPMGLGVPPQQGFAPQAPQGMPAPQQPVQPFQQPPQPQYASQQQAYPQQPMQQPQPGFAPQQPQGFAPQQPQGFAPQQAFQPAPPMMPPQGPPMGPPPGQMQMPPGYAPQQGAPPGPPQGQAPAQGGGRRGRGQKNDAPPAPTQNAAPVPPMGGVPQGFAPVPQGMPFIPGQMVPGLPQTQGFAPQQAPQMQQPQAVGVDLTPVLQRLDGLVQLVQQQGQQINILTKRLEMANMAITILGRAVYQKQGDASVDNWLRELNVAVPQ